MTTQAEPAPLKTTVGKYRWVVCALLFVALVINYVDRQMFGLLKPDLAPGVPGLQTEFGWTEGDYAMMVIYFQGALRFLLHHLGRPY